MSRIRVEPLIDAPIIPPPGHDASVRSLENVNGPSLIRVPAWVEDPLGTYYLYFADHKDSSIKLAFADRLVGPWTIHEPGALHLAQTPFLNEAPAIPEQIDRERLAAPRARGVPSPLDDCTIPHIASPEVIADEPSRTLRLYYHGLDSFARQLTRVAVSRDGLHFEAGSEILSPPYLRMFTAHERVR